MQQDPRSSSGDLVGPDDVIDTAQTACSLEIDDDGLRFSAAAC